MAHSHPAELEVVRDVLDTLLVDRNHEPLGRVDGIVARLDGTGPPRLLRLELGPVIRARRIGRAPARWIEALGRRFSPTGGRPVRIAWSRLLRFEREIEVNALAEHSPALALERCLRNLVRHIPHLKKDHGTS
jgi:hypothetical protein